MDNRRGEFLSGIDRSAEIIEIGPSYNSMAAKRDGWRTIIIDHGSQAELIEKYAHNPSVDTSNIEEVDFVWHEGSLTDCTPADRLGRFDVFVASHVIEHTTDIVRFLQSAEALLKPTGMVPLRTPDKRKCFDFFRPISTTADAVAAYVDRRQRHTVKSHLDHSLYITLKGGQARWAGDDTQATKLIGSIEHVSHYMSLHEHKEYVECHAWQFMPSVSH